MFRDKLKKEREKVGISQKTCAEKCQIPLRTFESWEAGERIPPEYVQRLVLEEIKRISI